MRMPIIWYRALHSYFNNERCRKAYAIRLQGDTGNVLIYLLHLAMAHPYRKIYLIYYIIFNILHGQVFMVLSTFLRQ